MKAIRLNVEPFEFLNVLSWDATEELGEHGVLRIKGLISEDDREAYYRQAASETWVSATFVDEEAEEYKLFQGILTNLSIHSEHELHTMEIEVMTGSYLLDQAPHTRSFQEDSLTYESVIETCLESEDGWMRMRSQANTPINQLIMQYKETNWSFIKRFASRLGLPLIPEFKMKARHFYVGFEVNGEEIPLHSVTYSIAKDKAGAQTYTVTSRDVLPLGQTVIFNDMRLMVIKAHRRVHGEELVNDYTLAFAPLPKQLKPAARQLNGLSLRGAVTAVKRDRVQIVIHDDANQADAGHRWFDYATVYSTPDGTGWFAMPEIGDEIRIVFPENDEQRAYVVSSVHLSTDGGRENPDHKSFKNKQEMEILMTPTEIILRDNQGQLIELSSASGIKMNSHHSINMTSGKQIHMNSGSNINLSAKNKVHIEQRVAHIHMEDDIDIAGGKINMNI